MHIQVSKEDIVEGPTDDRGRVYLGTQYANTKVEVAVLDHD